MPDALLLTPVTPATGGNGLAMRAGVALEGLARSFGVRSLVTPVFGDAARPEPAIRALLAAFDVLDLDRTPDQVGDLTARLASAPARARATALHPRPGLCRAATVAAAEAVASAATGVDLVHVHRLYLAPFLDALIDRADRPRLTIDLDDLDATTWRRLGDEAEAEAYDRLAAYYLPRVDRVLTASADDAVALGVDLFPNAVRPPAATPAATPSVDLLFVGNLSYGPNVDGVQWLCSAVLPLLPGVSVAVVGSRPVPEVLALASPDVTVAGDVADVTGWYARARVAVVPVRSGGGTRIKLLEALAHTRPVVTTTAGADGLGLVPGRDGVLVADEAPVFAAACRTLLDGPAAAADLARRGYAMVQRTATVDVVAARLDRLFLEVAGT